ncbi:PQQ-binding-like beta-propeller repeat protein [bacterium]|nr:PQQ-binding-like beta-propeller repeat protein [bacterium]
MKILVILSTIFFISCGVTQQSEVEKFHNSFSKKDSRDSFETIWAKQLINSDFREPTDIETSQPIISSDKKSLYVASSDGSFGKISLLNGVFLWKKQMKGFIDGDIYLDSNDQLIFFSSDNSITKIDSNGDTIWKTKLDNERVVSKIVGQDKNIFFKSSKERIYSIDTTTGEKKWITKSYQPEGFKIESTSSIVIKNSKLYSTFADGTFAIFDINTGKSLFETRFSTGEGFQDFSGELTLNGELLLIPSLNSGIIAFDISKNIELWQQKESAYSRVVVWKEFGFYLSDKTLIKISLNDGVVVEKIGTDIENIVSLIEHDNKLMIFSKNQGIYIIDLFEKNSSKQLLLSSGISGIPVIFDNQLIFLANSGILYSVKLHH